MPALTPDVVPGVPAGEVEMKGGRRTRGATAKALKKMLKKAGLKTTGRKAALTRRAKKAHLKIVGGEHGDVMMSDKPVEEESKPVMGGRRRSRKSKGYKLF